jgi:ABC-2 type transport system permease protein
MANDYNQFRAMMAVTRASLRATFKSPQSIFFSLFFPIVLMMIFGSVAANRAPSVTVALDKGVDTLNPVYQVIRSQMPMIRFEDRRKKDVEDEMRKGRITALMSFHQTAAGNGYTIHLRTSSASQRDLPNLKSYLSLLGGEFERRVHPERKPYITVSQTVEPGRRYKMVDFLLPGLIGFSLIGSAVFGIAFSFYSLRETLVLKRMYSTPIKRFYIILGESIGKVIFQLLTVVVLILFGYYVYGFFLANGVITFLEMMVVCFFALLVFMGFGFLISGVSRNQNVIPIYANLFMFPQYFLSGTFFPTSSLPSSVQPLIKYLPLTAVNDALRNIAFEGDSIWSCWPQMLVLLAWGVIIYAITVKVFRWE